jgi:Sugar phosphate isomerases/epimerases
MNNRFAAHTNSYHGFALEEALRGIAAAGFKYVELSAVRGWTEHVMPEMSRQEKSRIQSLLNRYGLEPIALSGHCNLMEAERLQDFERTIALAGEFGCRYIISSTGEAHFGRNEVFADEVLSGNIQKLIPALEKFGLTLALEIHGQYDTGARMLELVQKVNSPLVGINYDTANVVYYGGKSPLEDIKTCAPWVRAVHLKDKRGGGREWDFPGVGSGELPLAAFMDYMDRQGYRGPYSVEIEYTQDYCMREKDQPGDLQLADCEMADSYRYLRAIGRTE